MAGQPLNTEQLLAQMSATLVNMQQRADQSDQALAALHALVQERLHPEVPPRIEDFREEEQLEEDQRRAEQLEAEQRTAEIAAAAVANLAAEASNSMIAALTEKMAKLEVLMSKVEKGNTEGTDMDKFCVYPNAKLPPRFKMPDFSKFDGSSDPKTHLYGYHAAMKLHGVEDDAMAQMFPQTLSGPAFQWFMSIDMSKRRTWKDIGEAFVAQYSYNTQLQMTTRELEATKMEAKESFPDFVRRWKSKAALMTDRLSEKDQIRIISRNLQHSLARHLVLAQASESFSAYYDAGIVVEEALADGRLDKIESSSRIKSSRYSGNGDAQFNPVVGVNQIHNPQSNHAPRNNQDRSPCQFAAFSTPLSAVMDKLVKMGHLRPLDPKPLRDPLPPSHKADQYCAYHQMPGHHTEKCVSLRHFIQDLIDNGTIAAPPPLKPNTISNSMPSHPVDPRINQISLSSTQICLNSTIFDPIQYIVPVTQPKSVAPFPVEPEINVSTTQRVSETGECFEGNDTDACLLGLEICTVDTWSDSENEFSEGEVLKGVV